MILCSEQELRRQICRQRIAAALSFDASLLAVLSGGTLILFLFIHDSICIPAACFTVSVLILLLHAWWVRTQKALPARIPLPETLCFEDICERLRAAAVEDTCRTYTENSFFCRSTYRFDGRFLLVRMENFQKADFDAVKKRVNHAVNREFHLPQRYAAGELAYKMRFYILYTEAANDELMRHISRNAETLLRRAEGVMTFVLCGDSLIVPPLYGDADTAAVRRYAGAIRMMRDLLRHPRAH